MPADGRVSVIIPVYNREASIGRAIRSAIEQTYPNLEILVVDDGSTDTTPDVLRSFGAQIRVLTQPRRGAYAARNAGLREASGEYIAFLDSDDAWFPDRLARGVPMLGQRPDVGLVYGNGVVLREDRRVGRVRTFFEYYNVPARGRVFTALLRTNFIPQSSVLLRRRCLDEVGPFVEVPVAADHHKWLQLSLRYEFEYVEKPIFEYTLHAGNISRDRALRYQVFAELLADLERDVKTASELGALRQRRLELEFKLSLMYIVEGTARLARSAFGGGQAVKGSTRLAALVRVLAYDVARVVRQGAWHLWRRIR